MLFVIMASAVLLLNNQSASASSTVLSDKKEIAFTIDPKIEKGTTLVQLRPLFESLGIELEWNGDSRTVTGTKGDSTFVLTIGQRTATVNGKKVELALPGRLTDGHTLVPLRFVGEATGAVVGWHEGTRTISVLSSEYMDILGITREEAQKQANAGVTWDIQTDGNQLRGLYVHGSADLLGTRGCRGMCWDYYYFIDDHRVITDAPDGIWDNADCTKDKCFSYEIKNDQIVIDGKTMSMKKSDKSLTIDGDQFFKHEPLHRLKLDGKYDASSYISGSLGNSFSSSSTLIFRPDGAFFNDSWVGVISDGSDSGDGSGVSFTLSDESEASGRYTVINYSILLEYKDGEKEVFMFFRPDLNDRMLKIGGRDLLIDDSYDPDSATKPSDNEENPGPVEPYKDKLITGNIAGKKNIIQELPNDREKSGGIVITLDGYQWAELDISPENRQKFNGYGDGTIVALTARFTVANESSSDVDLSTLKSTIWLDTGHLPESREAAPDVESVLKAGKTAEMMAVFMVPADMAAGWNDPELIFSDLKKTNGEDVSASFEIGFTIDNPY